MQIIRTISELRTSVRALRTGNERIALVPTMGALHAGHMALVHEAQKLADHVVASIFVNPMQFGPNEDLDAYPRQEATDTAMLAGEGVALVWAPDVTVMYPRGHATQIGVTGLDTMLCGAARPGHFDGVATVVAKLFNQVRPEVALFGEKDWQQLAIIRRMASDLDFDLEIIGVPTVREADGLALSSRNAYLSADDRKAAAILPQTMRGAVAAMANGANVAAILDEARAAILSAGFSSVDYLELRDGTTLAVLEDARPSARLFAAARIGTTRLIDNIAAA
ncbi:MAG: pantoate--beta-alanine ligase [Pseudomonadota bacterium]